MGCSGSHATAVVVANPLSQAADNNDPPCNNDPSPNNDPPDQNDPPSTPTKDNKMMEGTLSTTACNQSIASSDISPTPVHSDQDSSRPEDTTTVGTNNNNDQNPSVTPGANNNNPGGESKNPNQGLDDAAQEQFQQALRSSCLLMKPEALFKCATKNVHKLVLPRALPHHIHLTELLRKLTGLQVDV